MGQEFEYDVFLSHSAKDKAVVRPLAERLRAVGLKVWFHEWLLKPGDSIPAKIDPPSLQSYSGTGEGLARSRVLVLCMSANAFGSGWAQLRLPRSQLSTLNLQLLCAPLNQERRFIPLRFDDAPSKGSLARFLYINWRPGGREQKDTVEMSVRPVASGKRSDTGTALGRRAHKPHALKDLLSQISRMEPRNPRFFRKPLHGNGLGDVPC